MKYGGEKEETGMLKKKKLNGSGLSLTFLCLGFLFNCWKEGNIFINLFKRDCLNFLQNFNFLAIQKTVNSLSEVLIINEHYIFNSHILQTFFLLNAFPITCMTVFFEEEKNIFNAYFNHT